MKAMFDNFKLRPGKVPDDAVSVFRGSVQFSSPALGIKGDISCTVYQTATDTFAKVSFRGIEGEFRVVTHDDEPYLPDGELERMRVHGDVAGEFASHVSHTGNVPEWLVYA